MIPASKCSLQWGFSLTHANQEAKASIPEISHPLHVSEEPQAQIVKPDLEIPHKAKITSIPLSFFSHLNCSNYCQPQWKVSLKTSYRNTICNLCMAINKGGRECQLLLAQFSKDTTFPREYLHLDQRKIATAFEVPASSPSCDKAWIGESLGLWQEKWVFISSQVTWSERTC